MKTRNYGKCILSGEHSVLRGGSSLLLPLKNFYFDIFYKESDFKVTLGETFFEKKYLNDYRNCIQKTLASVGQKRGHFHLECTLPIAAGLGSSAAFSLGVAQIFFQNNWISKNEIPSLSLQMENEFHGQSSGGDIRVIEQKETLLFKNFNDFEVFKLCWKPHLYLHDTKIRSETKKCIELVQQKNNSKIDEKMKNSVHQCVKALKNKHGDLFLLQEALNQASECFKEWGLYPQEAQQMARFLKNKGALAVKPTGSGGGGFLISLWKNPQTSLIPICDPNFT